MLPFCFPYMLIFSLTPKPPASPKWSKYVIANAGEHCRGEEEQRPEAAPPSPPESPFRDTVITATALSTLQTPMRVKAGDRAASPKGPPSPLKRDVVVAEPVSPVRGRTERPLVPGTLERASHHLIGLARKSNENLRAMAEGVRTQEPPRSLFTLSLFNLRFYFSACALLMRRGLSLV